MTRQYRVSDLKGSMKTLLIILPVLRLGGQERVAVETAGILQGSYRITFVVFDSEGAVYTPPCKVINLDSPAIDNRFGKVWNVLSRAYALRRIKKRYGAEISLSFGESANLVNAMSRGKDQVIVAIRGFESVRAGKRNGFIWSEADKIACCSSGIEIEMKRLFPQYADKLRCLPNPYHIPDIKMMGAESVNDYEFGSHTIATHGRLEEVKNYPRLIRAFSMVKDTVRDAQLLIIGEGSQREALQRLIDALGLGTSVTLLGLRKNPFAYLSRSKVYVLSSISEGFPNALVEGMVFLPVIAADCKTGPREILSNGDITKTADSIEDADYGILVKPEHSCLFDTGISEGDALLADAITNVLCNDEKAEKMKSAALSRVKEFSVDAYRKRFIAIAESSWERKHKRNP